MPDDLDALKIEIADLRSRCLALECETSAFSALFFGLAQALGPTFLQISAEIAESIEANPQIGSASQQRMTEALRIIEQIRAGSHRKPKPGQIVQSVFGLG